MASVRMASNHQRQRALENRCEEVMDDNSSYFIDTNSFSAQDFDRFVNSLEETYSAHFRTKHLDHSLGNHHESGEDIVGDDDYSIYQSLTRYAQDVEQISSYGGTPMSSTCSYPCTSEESLQPPEAPHNTRIREEPSPRIVKRKSFLNIFQYFDEDVTFDEDDRSDEDPVPEERISRRHQQVEKKKLVLREWDTNVERSKPHLHQQKQVGRLNAQLLKMFEGETEAAPQLCNNHNVSKARSALGGNISTTTSTKPVEKKVPIMQHNRIEQPKKAVNTVKRVAPKPPTKCAQSAREVECRRVVSNLQQRPDSSVKIVNVAPKNVSKTSAGPEAINSSKHLTDQQHNLNRTNVSERDKCYVRNINDLFLQYRSRERTGNGTFPDFNQHVREAIEQIEKLEESHVRSVLGQNAFDEVVLVVPPSTPCEKAPRNVEPSRPEKEQQNQSSLKEEESALDMHYRLRHETYRLQMHNLIETDQFVKMAMEDRNRLDLLDTIFNRSHLSLIHTVLALIQENISKGDQVLVQVDGGDGADTTFVDAVAGGSYRIDGMTTSAAGENCVVLDVIAVDEVTGRMIKITVEFLIDVATNPTSTTVQKPMVNNGDEFHFVVQLVFEVKCKPASKLLASSFYTVDCGMYWDRDRVVPFLRKCARTVRSVVRAVPSMKRHRKWWSAFKSRLS